MIGRGIIAILSPKLLVFSCLLSTIYRTLDISVFYILISSTHRPTGIEDMGERVLALTMLILLLPTPHRDTLHAALELCARVVNYEAENKMSLYNVAMIMAPNLFLPNHQRSRLHLKSEDKEQQLNHEVS